MKANGILMVPNTAKEGIIPCVAKVCARLAEDGFTLYMDESFRDPFGFLAALSFGKAERLLADCRFVIAIGGDGTLLHSAKLAATAKVPLLGINMGRLGFMATLESDGLAQLSRLRTGEYTTTRRMMLEASLLSPRGNGVFTALNDIVLQRETFSKLPELDVACDGVPVSSLRADGAIFSTPTGSTAYSLSAGGPIIEPELDCIEFTQLCAHSLFARTMVFAPGRRLRVTLRPAGALRIFVSVDGEEGVEFHVGDELVITRSRLAADLIDISGESFYTAVNTKLMRPFK